MSRYATRDRLALLAALAAPLALAAILVPFRAGFPNTDAALAMLLLVVVAVAANGYRLAGFLAAVSVFQGRFLMTPAPGERPPPEQRLLAVALADQVGAALATSHPVDQA
jgi:hypothetical protein